MLINGSNGDNRLVGTASRDTIDGNGGRDTIYGQGSADSLIGGQGADTIYGGNGDDTITGGNPIDPNPFDEIHEPYRGDGGDTIYGGNGADIINGGTGNDLLYGGPGADSFYWIGGNNMNEPDFGGQQDIIRDYRVGIDHFIISFIDTGGDWQFIFEPQLLDSNADGKIDDNDDHVDLRAITVNTVTRNSLVIDIDELALDTFVPNYFEFGGPQALTFFGVLSI